MTKEQWIDKVFKFYIATKNINIINEILNADLFEGDTIGNLYNITFEILADVCKPKNISKYRKEKSNSNVRFETDDDFYYESFSDLINLHTDLCREDIEQFWYEWHIYEEDA